jgi:hypothetical protein
MTRTAPSTPRNGLSVTQTVRKRQRRGPAKAVVGKLSDPPILVFSLSIGKDS